MFKRLKIEKGDMVVVTAGDHKGQQGRVIAVDRDKDRVTVEGVNMISRHRKPSAQNPQGGIEKREAGLHISNVMLIDAAGNATRVGKTREEGKLVRISKKSGGGNQMSYQPRLRTKYETEVKANLQKRFEYSSSMQVPCITKICLNQGIGKATADKKLVDAAVEEMTLISGQRAVATYSTKDISNFKLRKGVPIGARVTLRGNTMYEFLDRLIAVALPRTRDFRGVKASGFDGRGNFTFGVKEQIIFPEIDLEKVKAINGMDITFVTNAKTNEEAKALLEEFGFPFVK